MHMILRITLIVSGFITLFLGILGIVLPLLPTTPFLLLSAACFVRSSDRLYHWLITNKWFGKYIRDFREKRGIPLKAKVIGVTVLWVSMLSSAFFFVDLWVIRVLMILIGAFFTYVMLSFKTLR